MTKASVRAKRVFYSRTLKKKNYKEKNRKEKANKKKKSEVKIEMANEMNRPITLAQSHAPA